MAVTNPTQVDTSIPELWARLTLRDHRYEGFWGRFVGKEGSGAPIVQRADTLNNEGDLIHIQVTNPLSGAGVEGDTAVLEGNEENLSTTEKKASPILYRHGVRVNRRAQKKSIVDLRAECRMRLAEWGMNKMDTKRWENFNLATYPANVAGEAYTPNLFVVGNATTSAGTVDDIGNTDSLTTAVLQQIKVGLLARRARPLIVDGAPHYVLATHPYALYQLKREQEYRDWVKDADVRGAGNAFFRGATAVIDGMIIHDHFNCPIATNTGPIQYAKSIAFGAEAFVEALDENPSWDEDQFDYGHQWGVAYGFSFQPRRALELSSVQVYCYAPTVG